MHRSKQRAAGVLALLFTVICSGKDRGAGIKNVDDEKYKPGQVGSYKTRVNDQESTLTILRVEETPEKKRIVHIRVACSMGCGKAGYYTISVALGLDFGQKIFAQGVGCSN